MHVYICICVCIHVYAVCVCVCIYLCTHECVYACVCVQEGAHMIYATLHYNSIMYLQRGSKHKEKWMKEENGKFKSLHKQIDDGCYYKLGKSNLERREGRQIQSLARV